MLTVRVAMLAGLVASLAVPVLAQANLSSQAAPRPSQAIAFFERAKIGPLEVTPIGVIRDQRCSDPRFLLPPPRHAYIGDRLRRRNNARGDFAAWHTDKSSRRISHPGWSGHTATRSRRAAAGPI